MLRPDVVAACDEGRFHIWAVSSVHEALEIFTGVEAGSLGDDGQYPEESLLGQAQAKAQHFWERSSTSPAAYAARAGGQAAPAEAPPEA